MNMNLNLEKMRKKFLNFVRNAVKKIAAKSIGELKRSRNTWYNVVCRISVDKCCKAIN